MKSILMNTEMTKAILDGYKVQTRIVLDDMYQNSYLIKKAVSGNFQCREMIGDEDIWMTMKPKYQIGEIIWVAEDFIYHFDQRTQMCGDLAYREKEPDLFSEWSDASQMEERHSRISLKIMDVRVERLQDISEEDMQKEGVVVPFDPIDFSDGGQKYQFNKHSLLSVWVNIWNKIAPKGYNWEDNPYVFVYEFERVEK